MDANQDQSSRGVIIIIACAGVLSSLVVLYAMHLFFQRSQGDPFFASEEYMVFKEGIVVKNIRRDIAEEFVGAVVNCISPPIVPGQSLTEPQVNERVTSAMENYAASNGNAKNPKCENKNPHWTFELPCKLTLNRAPYKLREAVKLGDINICAIAIATSIRSAARSCTPSANFQACLVSSVLANDDVKKEIDKPVEIQAINAK
ncbi:MAG: hypothetical protein ACRECP_06975 [Methylocella sp.]